MDETNKLLTVKETAEFLGVTEIHLRKLLKEGKIAYVNLATGTMRQSIRIEKHVIDELIRNGGFKQ